MYRILEVYSIMSVLFGLDNFIYIVVTIYQLFIFARL